MKGLTDRQLEILQFIHWSIVNEGYAPSIREIGESFEITSLRGVTVHLDALERKGYIMRVGKRRAITVLRDTEGRKGCYQWVAE